MSSSVRPSRAAGALPLLSVVLATAIVACGGAAASPTPPSDPAASGLAPTPTPNATMAGPTAFAAWTARQGFGGGSGLAEVQKGADWLNRNPGASDRASWVDWWSSTADGLVFWLDTHPATPCWTAYHDAARQALGRIHDDFALIRRAVGEGNNIPGATIVHMLATATNLVALEQPADCP